MSRRKEIQWEAGGIVNHMIERGFSENRDTYDTYYQAFQDGALWADKTMIDKVRKWVEDNVENVFVCVNGIMTELNGIELSKCIRKAMEE